jgi:hypothetical protein
LECAAPAQIANMVNARRVCSRDIAEMSETFGTTRRLRERRASRA